MPLNRYVVRVDPQGQTVTVDVLDTSGVSVVTYDSPQFAAASRTLPLVITSQTDFWLHSPGPYDVSCKVGGAEVADAGAPKRVQVSDVPVLVVPDWERQRAATPGGSVPISRWNGYTSAPLSVANDIAYHILDTWIVNNTAGTDITVDPDTGLFTFAPGKYDFMVSASPILPTAATHLILDWRTNTGIIAGDVGLGQGPLPIVAKDNGVACDCNCVFWLEFGPDGGTVNVGIQTVGAAAALDCYAAIDIRRTL